MPNIIYIVGCNCQAWVFEDEIYVYIETHYEIAKLGI